MAYTVITRPAELSMSGNIADFVLDSNAPVTFKLAVGGKVILDEIYTPTSAGAITIKLRKVIEQQLTLSIPTSDFFEQSKSVIYFLATIDTIDYGFRVVKGGIDANVLDAATYLSQNFLTWQPQSKQVKLNDPEWLTYFSALYATKVVKAKGYYLDNTTETIVVYTIDEEPKCWTMNVQYALLAGKFTAAPSYIDVWVEDSDGVRLTFIQRYILHADFDEFDDLFVFENSLGGIDTIRYTGTLQEINEPDVASAIFGEETMEFGLDVDRYFSKNTGGFKSERQQQWAVDFFNSYNRYRIADGIVRRIVLRKADIKGVKRDVNSFSFNFAYTKQTNRLNLARFDTLPDVIEMVDPNSELFFLAPRLFEFPYAKLAFNFLFPVQSPYETKWYKATISDIAELLTVEGGIGSYALDSGKWAGHRWDDYMDQALKTNSDVEFNSLKVQEALVKSLESHNFNKGWDGDGFGVDENGNMEVKSLLVRDQLTVFELIIQKIRSVGGMIILSVASGTASAVALKENEYYRVTLENSGAALNNPFAVGDLVKCQRFTGKNVKYYWRKVIAIGSDYIDLANNDVDGTGIPEVGDELVQLGHITDPARQNAIIIDATSLPKIDIYQGINSYSLAGKLKSRLGDLSEQGINGMGLFTSQGRFTGQVVVGEGSTGYDKFNDKPDLSVYAQQAFVKNITDGLQAQIDGTITSWFKDYEPTLLNEPASNWGDAPVMEIHLGDLFYWTSKGYAYRFQKIDSVFSWTKIADTDVILALANAAKAQDTADGKRRVFTAQPTAPYDKGDLWAKGTAILKCDVPKVEGQSFSESDWSVTATDDTAVNNLQIGGRNLIINSKGEFTGSSQVYSFVTINQALSNVAGKTFTLSAEARVTEVGNDTRVLITANDSSWLILNKSEQSSVNNTSWEHISVTFTVPYDFSGDVIIGAYNFPHANSGSVALRYLKLEEGSKATGWTPAPEDVAADIANAQTAANEAILAVEGMGEDGLITPFEKKTLRQMVNQMLPEFNELIGQADNYNVDSDVYSDTYVDLLSFTDPLLSDMSATSAVDRTLLEHLFSSYNTYKINLLNAISNAINGTATTAKTAADDAAIIARAMASGKMLNRDPNFKLGWNGISTYNNSGGSALIITRNAAESDSPNYPGGFDMKISYVGGSNGASPGLGGFTFATPSRANAVFLVRIIAYIPIGYNIEWGSNALGTGGTNKWLTSTHGEGKFKEYLLLVRCGSSGTFSTINFFYLIGSNASAVNWWLCFATVYDTTSSESYEIAAATKTSIDGGVITSGVIQLGAADGSIKAGINGGGTSDDSVRFWAGAGYDNRALAPFRVWQSGEVFARKRIELLDENNYGLAGICGSNSASDGTIRFWAGETYANRANAPFRVDKDGTIFMSKATLSTAQSGRRVVISSSEGSFKFIAANETEAIVIKESSYNGIVYPGMFLQYTNSADKFTTSIESGLVKIGLTRSGLLNSNVILSNSGIEANYYGSNNRFMVSVVGANTTVFITGLPTTAANASGVKPLYVNINNGLVYRGT